MCVGGGGGGGVLEERDVGGWGWERDRCGRKRQEVEGGVRECVCERDPDFEKKRKLIAAVV